MKSIVAIRRGDLMINVVDVSEDENDNDDMMMMIHQPEQKLF